MQDDRMLLRSGAAARTATLDQMHAAGVDVVRLNLVWRRPAYAAARDVVTLAHARGMQVLVTLTTPAPDRFAERRPGARPGTWKPNASAFRAFAATARARLGAVDLWSIVNEPNSPNQLAPQWRHRRPASPAIYRRLVRAASSALRGRRLLLGEELAVAHAGRRTFAPIAPVTFARALFCLDGSHGCGRPLRAVGWSVHPYYPTKGPLTKPSHRSTIYPRSLGKLIPTLDAAFRRHRTRTRLDIWDTEDGVQTNPPDRYFGAPLAGQARAINEAEWLEWRAPRVRASAQYLWRDDLSPSGFQSGLFFADGAEKPSYAAYRLPLVVTARGHVWTRLPPGVATAALHGPHGLRRTITTTAPDRVVTLKVPARRGTYRVVAPGASSRKAHVA